SLLWRPNHLLLGEPQKYDEAPLCRAVPTRIFSTGYHVISASDYTPVLATKFQKGSINTALLKPCIVYFA
ncbi:MAG: hypothetical protein NWQ19_03565, partial [Nonlabens sp.]|nr:hypothetical protein [Nonlabens sp.]